MLCWLVVPDRFPLPPVPVNRFVGECNIGWATVVAEVAGGYVCCRLWMWVVESMSWTTLVGEGWALVSLAVSSSRLWLAVLSPMSPMSIARTASANSL